MTGEQRRQRADHSPTTPQTPSRRLHSSFTVGRIDLDEDHLSSEGVLLVDDRNGHVYLWCGQLSTFKHRGFGLEAAAALKADNPKGGQVRQGTMGDRGGGLGPTDGLQFEGLPREESM